MTVRHPLFSGNGPVPNSALSTPLPRVLRPTRATPADAVRPTRAEVNLGHLRHNLRVLMRHAGDAAVFGVLKADGYGHGAKAVARTLERAGVSGICVALLEEAVELREAGIRCPILVMGGYYGRSFGELLSRNLTPVLHDAEQILALADEVRFSGAEPARFHLKVDTGMARLGATPNQVGDLAKLIQKHPEVVLDGLMTHFACADSATNDQIDDQLGIFDQVAAQLRSVGLNPNLRHAANSAALLKNPRARLSLVRPGIALFGVEPVANLCSELRPVMRVRTAVVALRDLRAGQSVGYGATWTAQRPSRIATIPMGYADGLSRGLSNLGNVLIRGRRAPIAGVVSMDMTMLDVTDIPGVKLGDECVVLGEQKGELGSDQISVAEIAQGLNTVPWEIMTAISRRVPRFYREP